MSWLSWMSPRKPNPPLKQCSCGAGNEQANSHCWKCGRSI